MLVHATDCCFSGWKVIQGEERGNERGRYCLSLAAYCPRVWPQICRNRVVSLLWCFLLYLMHFSGHRPDSFNQWGGSSNCIAYACTRGDRVVAGVIWFCHQFINPSETQRAAIILLLLGHIAICRDECMTHIAVDVGCDERNIKTILNNYWNMENATVAFERWAENLMVFLRKRNESRFHLFSLTSKVCRRNGWRIANTSVYRGIQFIITKSI